MILYRAAHLAWVGQQGFESGQHNDPCNLPSISPSYSSASDAGWLERVALGFNLFISLHILMCITLVPNLALYISTSTSLE